MRKTISGLLLGLMLFITALTLSTTSAQASMPTGIWCKINGTCSKATNNSSSNAGLGVKIGGSWHVVQPGHNSTSLGKDVTYIHTALGRKTYVWSSTPGPGYPWKLLKAGKNIKLDEDHTFKVRQ